MCSRFSRRGFLKRTAGVAGALTGVGVGRSLTLLAAEAPSNKLATAVIGSAGQGMASVQAAAGERLVALVDVDDNRMAGTLKWVSEKAPNAKGVKSYFDYRKMLDECAKEIDVVFVATPDHSHAPASMAAIQLGKHCFCEKPLTHDIAEARAVAEAARKHKVMTQMGNQGHSGEGYRRLCEYLWAGAIGNVLETHTWIGMVNGGTGGRPPSKPVPQGLHWDEWLGPAALRDYHDGVHPASWRGWWSFGGGSLADWACHQSDGVFWALKLAEAKTCTIECLEQFGGSDERFPVGTILRLDFPARGEMPPVKVFWYDGMHTNTNPDLKDKNGKMIETVVNQPPIALELQAKSGLSFDKGFGTGGTVYVGDKGVMYTHNYGGGPRIVPEEKHKAFPVPEKTIPRVNGGHFGDFLRACRDGKPSCADFSYSGPLTEFVLLGQLGIKAGVGKKVEWDAANLKVTNLPELNQWVKREHRKGWEV